MPRLRTTLVLGAGASEPYGLPTASELFSAIKSGQVDYILHDTLSAYPHYHSEPLQHQLDGLKDLAKASNSWSIDRFLEHRTEFEALGKQLISCALSMKEQEALARVGEKDCWMNWLLPRILDDLNQEDPGIAVISFNYDRIFEISLCTTIASVKNLDFNAARRLCRRIPVQHMYGNLSTAFDYARGNAHALVRVTRESILESAKHINTIPMSSSAEAESQFQMNPLITDAERIVFLGFGYDKTNLQRIGIDAENEEWSGQEMALLGTARGKIGVEKDEIMDYVGSNIVLGESEQGCLEFLRANVRW